MLDAAEGGCRQTISADVVGIHRTLVRNLLRGGRLKAGFVIFQSQSKSSEDHYQEQWTNKGSYQKKRKNDRFGSEFIRSKTAAQYFCSRKNHDDNHRDFWKAVSTVDLAVTMSLVMSIQ